MIAGQRQCQHRPRVLSLNCPGPAGPVPACIPAIDGRYKNSNSISMFAVEFKGLLQVFL